MQALVHRKRRRDSAHAEPTQHQAHNVLHEEVIVDHKHRQVANIQRHADPPEIRRMSHRRSFMMKPHLAISAERKTFC